MSKLDKNAVLDLAFSSLNDFDASIKKIGITLVKKLVEGLSGKGEDLKGSLEHLLDQHKLHIIKITIPFKGEEDTNKGSSKQIDTSLTTKCLQLIQTIVKCYPNMISKE